MISPHHSKLKLEPDREHERKQRRCLKCHKLFMSDWLGERICPKCKSLPSWVNGSARVTFPDHG